MTPFAYPSYSLYCLKNVAYINHSISTTLSHHRATASPFIYSITTTRTTTSAMYSSKPTSNESDIAAIQDFLQSLFPNDRLLETQCQAGGQHSQYFLKTTNGLEVILKSNSPQPGSFINYRQYSLEAEAHILSILATSGISYIPKLLGFESRGYSPRAEYLFRHSVKGEPLSDLRPSVTAGDMKCIHKQLGTAVQQIGEYTATTFGSVYDVQKGTGYKTWNHAFFNLLESALWNAENMLISLPYLEIREQARRLSDAFDEVIEPRLVIVDIGQESNIIIDPETKELAGFSDFTSALWGDVLITRIFEEPSPDLLEGYGLDPAQSTPARIRLLL